MHLPISTRKPMIRFFPIIRSLFAVLNWMRAAMSCKNTSIWIAHKYPDALLTDYLMLPSFAYSRKMEKLLQL